MNDLKANLENVCSRVEIACANAGRDASEVTILAVSKKHPAERIRALQALGQFRFGENYVQEALTKQAILGDLDIEWHFIGPLQSNKTREVAEHFQWVQSVDRVKILRRLSAQRPPELPPLSVCLQVNIDREPQKAGLAPETVQEVAQYAASLDQIQLRGLMAIPRAPEAGRDNSGSFREMRELFNGLREAGFALDTLSMGMSADLETAIMEGSTMVRVGTDLLGPRANDTEKDN
jgi:pyridoxal phosphate enzyme (YggS family)